MDLARLLRNHLDRTIAVLLALLGLLAIYLGWLGVSDHVLPSQQIPYLASGGVVGLFLLGVGATLWLSSDLRDEWRKLDEVAGEVRSLRAADESHPGEEPAPPPSTSTNGTRPRRRPVRADAR